MAPAFEAAVAADAGFALGHAGLARARQFAGDIPGARAAMAGARALAGGLTRREVGHVHAMGLLTDGEPAAYAAIRAHVATTRATPWSCRPAPRCSG